MGLRIFWATGFFYLATLCAPLAAADDRVPFMLAGQGGTGVDVVKVLDLPDTPILKRQNGTYVDLGYKWNAAGEGAWVGYIGSPNSYVPLDTEKLGLLKMAGGIIEMPPLPKRPVSINYWYILLFAATVLATCAAICALRSVVAQARAVPEDVIDFVPAMPQLTSAVVAVPVPVKPQRSLAPVLTGCFAARERQQVHSHQRFGRR